MTGTTIPALKERAGVVAALADGAQVVLLRNPNLEPQEYEDWFALYPAYSHQSRDRYAADHRDYFRENGEKPDDGVPVRAVARLADEWTVDGAAVDTLADYYVYSPTGIREKYDADDGDQVRVLLLRVAELPDTHTLDEQPTYRGCRTWIELDDSVDLAVGNATPVLDGESFEAHREAIDAALS